MGMYSNLERYQCLKTFTLVNGISLLCRIESQEHMATGVVILVNEDCPADSSVEPRNQCRWDF